MQGGQNSFQIILPTKHLLKGIQNQQASFSPQFIVGYRNVVTQREDSIEWGLVRNKNYCGKAFTFPIHQQEALKVQYFRQNDQVIQRVGNNFLILKVEQKIVKPTAKLSLEGLKKLLQDLGGVNKINLNILKNAFGSFHQYRSLIDKETEEQLNLREGQKEIDIANKVKIQFSSKKLSGESLRQLPILSKQTGNWSENQTVELKVLQN